jgi:hypothetical protein
VIPFVSCCRVLRVECQEENCPQNKYLISSSSLRHETETKISLTFSLVGLLWEISMVKENIESICKYPIEICGLLTIRRERIDCRT